MPGFNQFGYYGVFPGDPTPGFSQFGYYGIFPAGMTPDPGTGTGIVGSPAGGWFPSGWFPSGWFPGGWFVHGTGEIPATGDLLDAIIAAFNAHEGLTTAFGQVADGWPKLWKHTAVPRPPLPYAVVMRIGRPPPELTFQDTWIEQVQIQISIFADDPTEAEDLARTLTDHFDRKTGRDKLRWADGYEMAFFPDTDYGPVRDPGEGRGGVDVWMRVVNYRVMAGGRH